ncbi:dTDP-4-dehydrorhamnose reductase [Marinobacterium lutimaris]|uniref:dTDP-4-dehydrorhamnose reductase n=1 Tax=Marinobacterium lutimaris TaxID=568106 RepID=A0A1H6BAI4_9GAMM|nr:dTDP-4-dehydrorhamnose reductase [Marinobacterium lutimaris]SEG57375.1 dTDP-4-dehydrorhamnose reductase [Marinobacterium lutimaris]
MRVLITGARGQVGRELLRLAPDAFEVIGLDSASLDITHAKAVEAKVAELQPGLIINAAAYTAVDKAESDAERAWAVNRDGVANLACAAEKLGIPVLHISTDYVFAGDADSPYRETDTTGPTGVYGASKLAGEQALAEGCSRYIVLRTSWVFGALGNNFVKTMLRVGKERDTLSVVADQQGGPTSAAAIAKVLWLLAQRHLEHQPLPWGVYHLSGAPDCSWFEFAQEIFAQAEAFGLLTRQPQVLAIKTEQYPTPAKRPAWSVLDSSKLSSLLGMEIPQWKDDLKKMLAELKQGNVEPE